MHKNLARRCVMLAALLLFMGGLHAAVVAQSRHCEPRGSSEAEQSTAGAWICTAKSPTKVTIALYGTPQCAITRDWYLGTIAPLAKQHPDKVSVVMGQFWFHGPPSGRDCG
jgi:hypothetical protein